MVDVGVIDHGGQRRLDVLAVELSFEVLGPQLLELFWRETCGHVPPRAPERAAVVAASITVSGVSGLIEQSGPSSRKRPSISAIARRPRVSTSAGGMPAISGLAGSPPTTARPVRRWASRSEGLPGIVAQLSAVAG